MQAASRVPSLTILIRAGWSVVKFKPLVWSFRRRKRQTEPVEPWSPRGRWKAPIERVEGELAFVGDITFEDGSRWQGLAVGVNEGQTPEEAVEGAIQSLIDEGEFELCLYRLDTPVTYESVAQRLVEAVPETRTLLAEHVAVHERVLPYVFLSDVTRFLLAAYRNRDTETVRRLLAFFERAKIEGDPETQNLIAVEFLETVAIGLEPDEVPDRAFFDLWGPALRDEYGRHWPALPTKNSS